MPADTIKARIAAANAAALARLTASQPVWTDVRPALEVLPGMTRETVLHAGPPIAWADMCGPQKMGVVQAVLHEGLAETEAEAEARILAGEITVAPCHEYDATGGMAGITSASSPMAVVHDAVHGVTGYSQLFQGPAAGLQDRALYHAEARKRWRWLEEVAGPVLGAAVRSGPGIPVKPLMARSLEMGDECHNRNAAATALLLNALILPLCDTCDDPDRLAAVLRYFHENEQVALVLSMAAAKAMTLAISGLPDCSLVTTMCRNGVDFGIRVSALGDRWFTAPANRIEGLYFSSEWTDQDAVPDIGDSAIMETIGLGGHAQAAAPALQHFVGGSFDRASAVVRQMAQITEGPIDGFRIAPMDFAGIPAGIDIRKVVQTGIAPVIDTAIAHRQGGVIGAGQTTAPRECFSGALRAFGAALAKG
ncbi:DUF1116 domain-containing protein [Mesobacterium pallidum]|uniref:DUF1116 domain-containing protein n=1 Tax=Mesobacterium pallidum TaxID=2872037 RepID=UPI001EE27836|nr:DUF1116 domain-containing protein [Mesobacterium pallidum]